MTDHTAAARTANTNQLSDEYVNAVIQRHGYDSPESVIAQLHQWIGLNGGENSVTLLMYEAHKALTKLRARVADERVALSQYDYQDLFDAIGKAVKVHPNLAIEISVQAFRAALATAPVAAPEGNADAWLTLDEEDSPCMLFFRKEEARTYCNPGEEPIALVRADRPRPQDAGGPVRIPFPTHLRKMWSGGEVQAWLDEHQGVTAPKPSAKGSLERFRRWQAEQASQAQCSCPSGDGSLRWPCAKHRTHSENDS